MKHLRWFIAVPLIGGVALGFGGGAVNAATLNASSRAQPAVLSLGAAYDLELHASNCVGSTVCNAQSGEYVRGGVDAFGPHNGQAIGRPARLDMSCEHDFTSGDIRHQQSGSVFASPGGGIAGVLGNGSETAPAALGLLLINGTEFGGNSGSASGVFTADNEADSPVTAHVTISLHGNFTDFQTNTVTGAASLVTITSLQCTINSSAPSFQATGTGESELE